MAGKINFLGHPVHPMLIVFPLGLHADNRGMRHHLPSSQQPKLGTFPIGLSPLVCSASSGGFAFQ
jgi:hypothetical protein